MIAGRLSEIVHGKHLVWLQAQRKHLVSGHYSATDGGCSRDEVGREVVVSMMLLW